MRALWDAALKASFFLGFALALTHLAAAQEKPDAKAVLRNVREAYSSLKQYEVTIRMTFEQVSTTGEKQVDTKTFKLTVQRPDRIRMESDNADMLFGEPLNTGGPVGPMLLVGDGKSVSVYAAKQKTFGRVTSKVSDEAAALVSNPSNWVTRIEQAIFLPVVSILEQTDPVQPIGEEHIMLDAKDIDCYVIQPSSGVSKLWIDKHNYLIVREVNRDSDVRVTIDFLVGRVNAPLPADFFVLTPPADAKQEDIVLTRNPFQ